jgi:hypothetical protein
MSDEQKKIIGGEEYIYQSAPGSILNPHPVWLKAEKKPKPKKEHGINGMPIAPMEEIYRKHKIYS